MIQKHNITPIFNQDSHILILGSFPSVKSREAQFFYHHPQNRFWKVMSALYHEQLTTIQDKKDFLLKHRIALWDVIQSCDIHGSSDHSIDQVIPNDIASLIKQTHIHTIYTNGKKAYELYQKYCFPLTHIEAIPLPSTSSANAQYSLSKLIDAYRIILSS